MTKTIYEPDLYPFSLSLYRSVSFDRFAIHVVCTNLSTWRLQFARNQNANLLKHLFEWKIIDGQIMESTDTKNQKGNSSDREMYEYKQIDFIKSMCFRAKNTAIKYKVVAKYKYMHGTETLFDDAVVVAIIIIIVVGLIGCYVLCSRKFVCAFLRANSICSNLWVLFDCSI